jgi:hypothetical protein
MADHNMRLGHEARREDHGGRGHARHQAASFGGYRSDDRAYHERYRQNQAHRGGFHEAVEDYYRAARAQRDDYDRWSRELERGWDDQAHSEYNPDRDQHMSAAEERAAAPGEMPRGYAGRGRRNYRRSDDRIRVILTGTVADRRQKRRAADIAECSSGVIDVSNQLRIAREANGRGATAGPQAAGGWRDPDMSQPVTGESAKGSPSKTSAGTTA